VTRIGTQHQAGSDSLLTAATFFKMRKVFFDDRIEDEFYRCGHAKPQNSFVNDLCDC
jgi:CCR4-NOT transcription complex subunit 7/8